MFLYTCSLIRWPKNFRYFIINHNFVVPTFSLIFFIFMFLNLCIIKKLHAIQYFVSKLKKCWYIFRLKRNVWKYKKNTEYSIFQKQTYHINKYLCLRPMKSYRYRATFRGERMRVQRLILTGGVLYSVQGKAVMPSLVYEHFPINRFN